MQRLNRLQNTLELFLADASTGQLRTILTEQDSTWVDVVRRPDLAEQADRASPGSASATAGITSTSCRATASRSSCSHRVRFDVLDVVTIDDKGGWLYYLASPDNPTQRYLWRVRLDGKGKAEQVTPAALAGVTRLQHLARRRATRGTPYSNMSTPPTIDLVRLPTHASVRTVVTNEKLKAKLAAVEARNHRVREGRRSTAASCSTDTS